MAESNNAPNSNVFSENDPLDINELASLNEEISTDFIEQLQNQIAANANIKNDGDLFEEPAENEPQTTDDTLANDAENKESPTSEAAEESPREETVTVSEEKITEPIENIEAQKNEQSEAVDATEAVSEQKDEKNDIETISGGNITEKPLTKENVEYSKSLDYLDDNIKYAKYVVYIDPENKDFIDSLTVKERKNIINRILREQDSIAVTKRKLAKMQAVVMHLIIAVLTVTIAIPCIYWTINASLEATINNYRASQSNFEQLYREHGKIKTNKNIK